VARATAHHWRFERTGDGWKIRRRTSRALDGDENAHRLLADGVRAHDLPVGDGPFRG